MKICTLKNGETADVNVNKNHVVLSVGSADRVEYDFETETEAFDAMQEYKDVLTDFLALLSQFKDRQIDFNLSEVSNECNDD